MLAVELVSDSLRLRVEISPQWKGWCHLRLPGSVEELAGYARIDCFYQPAKESPTKKERVIILEINTLPGMTPATCIFHQAAEIGMKPMEFIDQIIQYGLEEHSNQPKNSDTLSIQKQSLVSNTQSI